MMNDENFYNKKHSGRVAFNLSQDDPHRAGIQFARRVRLARMVGLAAMFFPIAGCWSPIFFPAAGGFCWLAGRSSGPILPGSCPAVPRPVQPEMYNLKSMPLSPGSGLA
jgi:diguanylate cyclase